MKRKDVRKLNKKRKLEALAKVSKLNENDNELKRKNTTSTSENEASDKSSVSGAEAEPLTKRAKSELDNEPAIDDEPWVISDADYKHIKNELARKQRERRVSPKIRLKLFGESASLGIDAETRTPLFLTDIQHLIMFTLFGSSTPCVPSRWCHLERPTKVSHTVTLVIDGLSLFHFSSYESLFENCSKIFETKLEVVTPSTENGPHVINELITVPCTAAQTAELIKKFGSLEAALDSTQDPVLLVKDVFPVENHLENQIEPESHLPGEKEQFPRTQLLLSALQMVDEGYPLPLRGELANRFKDFVLTKDSYVPVTAKSPMFGLDCEMCRTSSGANELTRISIVNEDQQSIYETLVCPKNKIVDYLTHYSGITPEMMQNVTKTLSAVQQDVREILPADAILVGQSLQSDLMAMRMMHPYVIDTSIIFNLSGDRRRKSKLQTLSSEFLGETIQKNPLGHDSIEDCSASLKLTKLKLNNGIDFGDAILASRRRFHEKSNELSNTSNDIPGSSQIGITNSTTGTTTTSINASAISTITTTTTTSTTTRTDKRDRSTVVITADETNTIDYQALINQKFATNGTTADDNLSNTNIQIQRNDTNKGAVENTCQTAINYALTLSHLKVASKSLNENKIEKTLKKVDRWIASIWESVAPHCLFVVVMGGNVPGQSSGVALMQVK